MARGSGGRRPASHRNAAAAAARRAASVDEGAVAFNALPQVEQRLLRRTVRMGRALETREQAQIAVSFARFQRSQPGHRLFWLLFVPLLVLSLAVAAQLHTAVIGVVLALAAQRVWGWISVRRVEKVNRHLLS